MGRNRPLVALGAMTFGGQTNAADADKMLSMFLDAGHSWVDTAFVYTEGRSEKILGKLMRGGRRDKIYLATKAAPDKLGEGKPRGLTPGSVRGQLEASLSRMKTDRVELLYLHQPDNKTPLEVTLGACEDLKAEGKISCVGLSNYASWQVAEAAEICRRNGWQPPTVYQGMYNAITRAVEEECIPACRHYRAKFVAYNPLAAGLLTGKYKSQAELPDTGRFKLEVYRARYWKDSYFHAIFKAERAARKARIPLVDAAFRWMMHHSQADGVIIGASKVEHMKIALAACAGRKLPGGVVKGFDEAWEMVRPTCPRYWRA